MFKTAVLLKVTREKSYSDACLIAGIFYLIACIVFALYMVVFAIYNAVRSGCNYIDDYIGRKVRGEKIERRERGRKEKEKGRREKRLAELEAQRIAIMRGDPLQ